MSPYLQAYTAYHRHGEPWIPWTVALDWHLQNGVVIADSGVFVMARPVDPALPHEHPQLICHGTSSTWHVWAAGGDMWHLAAMAEAYGVEAVTFQRRGRSRVRHLSLCALNNRGRG